MTSCGGASDDSRDKRGRWSTEARLSDLAHPGCRSVELFPSSSSGTHSADFGVDGGLVASNTCGPRVVFGSGTEASGRASAETSAQPQPSGITRPASRGHTDGVRATPPSPGSGGARAGRAKGTSVARPRCRRIRAVATPASKRQQPQPPAAPRTGLHVHVKRPPHQLGPTVACRPDGCGFCSASVSVGRAPVTNTRMSHPSYIFRLS